MGHHVPCHLKALGRAPAGPAPLALIPGLGVHTIDVSCSGMAGTFGLKAGNYETSLAAGRPMLDELQRSRAYAGSTECSTCRLQMEDGGHKRTLHPVQYLALAYGFLPELRDACFLFSCWSSNDRDRSPLRPCQGPGRRGSDFFATRRGARCGRSACCAGGVPAATGNLVGAVALAINAEFAEAGQRIRPTDEIALATAGQRRVE